MAARMPALTSLRFFAAAAVVAYHAAEVGRLPSGWLHWSRPQQAVSVFFVLSGFVLQIAYGGDLRGLPVAAVFARRIARIWPLHAFVAVALLALVPSWAQQGSPLLALALLHGWSFRESVFFWQANVPSWSLCAELAFYAAFPWLTGPARRRPALLLAAAALWLAGWLALLHPGGEAATFAAFYINPLARFPEFILGLCAAEALPWLLRLRRPAWVWTAAELATLGAVPALGIAAAVWRPEITAAFGAGPAEWATGASCAPAAAAAILVLAAGRGAVARLLAWPPLVYLGEISFAIYMVHWPLLTLRLPGGLATYAALLLMLTALLHRYLELPAMAASTRLLGWFGRARRA